MALQLDSDMSDSLDKILEAAGRVLNEVHAAYHDGVVTESQIDTISHLRLDLGQLLAKFSDGPAFATSNEATVELMRAYEEMADSWLRAVGIAAGLVPVDEWERTGNGDYLVTRTRQTAAGSVMRKTVAQNPAVAFRDFDEAEDAA